MSTVMLPAVRETEVEAPEKSIKEGLEKALAVLREGGWCQHTISQEEEDGRESHCALGALWEVMEDDPIYFSKMAVALTLAIGKEPGDMTTWVYTHADGETKHYQTPDTSGVARWNDDRLRKQEQVEMIFEYAIEKAEE